MKHRWILGILFLWLLGALICSAAERKFDYAIRPERKEEGAVRYSSANAPVVVPSDGIFTAAHPPEGLVVPRKLEKYLIAGEPLLFEDPVSNRAFVNAAFFTDLRTFDATRPLKGEKKIGGLKELSFTGLFPRQVAKFLVEWGAIRTYQELESRVRITRERETGDSYTAIFEGDFHLVGMIERWEPLLFSVTIDKKTGGIFYTCLAFEPCPVRGCLGACHRGL